MRPSALSIGLLLYLSACQTLPETSEDLSSLSPIDRVKAAYQVERLHAAKTIRVEDDIRQEYPDHDYGPDFHDLSEQRRHHIVDVQNQSGSSEYLTKITGTYYHGRSVLADGKSRYIIYPNSVFQDQGDRDFISEYGPVVRSSEAMLALWLDKAADTARLDGEEMWLGETHDKITFDFPNSPPLSVLVQKDTGYISKMYRIIGQGMVVSYTFDNYGEQNGIPVAREHSVYAGRERLYYSFNRKISLDDRADVNAFTVEPDIVLEAKRVDQSKMTAERTTNSLVQVGQDDAYTSFMKTDQGLVAFGAEAGFSERLKAYRDETSDRSPLIYAIVSSHHNVRLGGVTEAVAAGASLLVTQDAEARVRAQFENSNITPRLETISTPKSIGTVTVYNLATSNASENLVAFNSSDGVLVQTSHYAAPFESAPLRAELNAVTLMEKVEPLGITPTLLVSTDSRRAERWDVYEQAVANFDPTPCQRTRRICDGIK